MNIDDKKRYSLLTYEDGFREGFQKGSWQAIQSMNDLVENKPLPHYIMVHCCDNPSSCTKKDNFMERVKEMAPNAYIDDKKSLWKRVKIWLKR
jgi:hypothetical protein